MPLHSLSVFGKYCLKNLRKVIRLLRSRSSEFLLDSAPDIFEQAELFVICLFWVFYGSIEELCYSVRPQLRHRDLALLSAYIAFPHTRYLRSVQHKAVLILTSIYFFLLPCLNEPFWKCCNVESQLFFLYFFHNSFDCFQRLTKKILCSMWVVKLSFLFCLPGRDLCRAGILIIFSAVVLWSMN